MPLRWTKTRLLTPADLPPSSEQFRVIGAFNPAAARIDGHVVLLVRVAEQPLDERAGQIPLPRYGGGRQRVDWFASADLEQTDRRVARVLATGEARLTSASHLRVVHCGFDHAVQRLGPAVLPTGECEEFGIEDPRITPIGDRYFITYVAVSRHGAATALMSTTDFESFERHGVIFATENKDVVLLPERIGEDYIALHRPVCSIPFTGPEIWSARSPDLMHWGQHRPLYRGVGAWENGRVGAGAPPVRTPRGWLEIYHGNRRGATPGDIGAYCGGGMLLDIDNPQQVVQLAPQPLLEPTESFEQRGFVPNVVFPGGIVEDEDRIAVYYGAADESTAVAESTWRDLWTAFDS